MDIGPALGTAIALLLWRSTGLPSTFTRKEKLVKTANEHTATATTTVEPVVELTDAPPIPPQLLM